MNFDPEKLGLPAPMDRPGGEDALCIEAAVGWIEQNTSFVFVEGEAVPGAVKLFILKYCGLMESGLAAGVRSESLAGMSQSFAEGAGLEAMVRELAGQLLAPWYRGAAFLPAQGRWI